MANYHLHSMFIFLHYQIRFSYTHARILVFEYKSVFFFFCFRAARAHADMFFKNYYTIKLLEDRPVSVCTVKCLNLQRNARNLDWLTVPVHRTLLRDWHHCAKRSTPLQLSPICFTLQKQVAKIEEEVWWIVNNLFIAVVCCSMIQLKCVRFERNSSEMMISAIF